jgi:hypothetical protein
VIARGAYAGASRPLTTFILRLYPQLRLVDVLEVISAACTADMRRPVPGGCQTLAAGLATIDVRGPGWIDARYPIGPVVDELAEAGFGPHDIVALFNGDLPIEALAGALAPVFPDYVADPDDEALGARLAERWRCALPCCQSGGRPRSLRTKHTTGRRSLTPGE